jgi:hypothetical protein
MGHPGFERIKGADTLVLVAAQLPLRDHHRGLLCQEAENGGAA